MPCLEEDGQHPLRLVNRSAPDSGVLIQNIQDPGNRMRACAKLAHTDPMSDTEFDEDTLRALAEEGNTTALDRLAELLDARGDVDGLSELLDEGSTRAGRLLTRRAVERRDLRELQRLSDAGSDDAGAELERLLRGSTRPDR